MTRAHLANFNRPSQNEQMAEVDLNELERYLRIFQENPDSRVFAPLADLYRRLGRLSEAEDICREGMKRHPYYAGGRVALAHIFLDGHRFAEALDEAEQVVTYYPDNLLARKILIRVLGGLGEVGRARREFDALKHLAPQLMGDPELERALQGPAKTASSFAEKPSSAESSPHRNAIKTNLRPMELQERTSWDPVERNDPYLANLKKLRRKKLLLEAWIARLSTEP